MISLRSGLCILASTGVSLQKVVVAPDVLTFEFLDPFAIKLTLLAVRYLQFPFSCLPLTRRRQLSSL